MARAWQCAQVGAFAVALVFATTSPAATPLHYRFAFTLAAKPYDHKNYPDVKISGSGSGSFSIRHRQIDRDGTVFWDITDGRGGFTLRQGRHVIVRATVVDGHYGTEKTAGSLLRSVVFNLHLTWLGVGGAASEVAEVVVDAVALAFRVAVVPDDHRPARREGLVERRLDHEVRIGGDIRGRAVGSPCGRGDGRVVH